MSNAIRYFKALSLKQLLQIRMDELAKLVGQSSVQKSVLSAYGDQGGFVLAPQDNLF